MAAHDSLSVPPRVSSLRRSTRASSVASEDAVVASPVKRGRAASTTKKETTTTATRRSTRASSVLSEDSVPASPVRRGRAPATPNKESSTPHKKRQSLRSRTLKEGLNDVIKEVEESNAAEEGSEIVIDVDDDNIVAGEDKNVEVNKSINGTPKDEIAEQNGPEEQLNKSVKTPKKDADTNSLEVLVSSKVVTPRKSPKYNIRDDITPKKVSSPLKRTSELMNNKSQSTPTRITPKKVSPMSDFTSENHGNESNDLLEKSRKEEPEEDVEENVAVECNGDKTSPLKPLDVPMVRIFSPLGTIKKPTKVGSPWKETDQPDEPAIVAEANTSSTTEESNTSQQKEQQSNAEPENEEIHNESIKIVTKEVRMESVETPKSKSNEFYVRTPHPAKVPKSRAGK